MTFASKSCKMPSKRRPTRRKRTNDWLPVLWIALGANVALGLLFSPLTKGRIVRTEGADEIAKPYIARAIKTIHGVPAAQLNKYSIESKVMLCDAVQDVTYTQNLFGRGLMKVKMRTPVARLESNEEGRSVFLDAEGSVFRGVSDEALPILKLPVRFASPTLSIAAQWQSERIAKMCEYLATNLRETPISVEVTERGVIQLRSIDGGALVVLGSSDRWDKKVATLSQMLAQEPDLWKRYSEVNLTDPGNPMATAASR